MNPLNLLTLKLHYFIHPKSATTRALKASIAKWTRWSNGGMRKDEHLGCSSCPLCTLFVEAGCRGCPVYATTGYNSCRFTPYGEAHYEWQADPRRGQSERFKKAAAREAAFLKSLLK